MEFLVLYLATFLIIYILYYFFVICNPKKIEKFKSNMYITYLKKTYKVNIEKVGIKKVVKMVAFTNTFIIVTTVFMVEIISNVFLKFLMGFLILIPFQLLMYHIMGIYLRKNKGGKNV